MASLGYVLSAVTARRWLRGGTTRQQFAQATMQAWSRNASSRRQIAPRNDSRSEWQRRFDYLDVLVDLCRASVNALLLPCRPVAIVWLVVAVGVFAVDGMFTARPWSHIGQEGIEAVQPSVAYANASPSVQGVVASMPVGTAHAHIPPCDVLGSQFSTGGVTVAIASLGRQFVLAASATGLFPAYQDAGGRDGLPSAVAQAKPFRLRPLLVGTLQHNKSSESFAGVINECGHASSVAEVAYVGYITWRA